MDGLKKNDTVISHSDSETLEIGKQFGRSLSANSILCFFGDLGAGKTTFIKGVIAEAAKHSPDQVNSPTFNYLNIYPGPLPVFHFDLYRLNHSDEFLQMGFDDFFQTDGICCIEWSERIHEILPNEVWHISLEHLSENERKIVWVQKK